MTALKTVYPGVNASGVRIDVTASNLVTPIPNSGAVVDDDAADWPYYDKKLRLQVLLDYDPAPAGGVPIDLVIPTITVVGGPGSPGDALVLVSGTTAEFTTVAASTTYQLPGYGVLGNGSTDDGPALNALVTVASALGAFTFTFTGPRSYLINTNVSLPRACTVEPENGAVLVVGANRTLTHAGAIEAPPLQRWLNTNASGSTVLIPGGTVYPEWWGAVADDGTTNNHDPIWAALNSLRGGKGGVLRFTDTRGYYGTATTIVFATDAIFSGITIEGMGWNTEVKHTTARAHDYAMTDDGLFTLGATNSIFTVRNIKLSGYDTTDHTKLVRLGFCDKVVFDTVWINNNAREGLYAGDGANGCKEVSFVNCKATNIGLWVPQPVSAFNANANKVVISACVADNCGFWVEHTGVGLAITGCLFTRATSRGIAIMSTSWCNGEVVVAGNVLTDASVGVFVADGGRSVGKLLITANVILRCSTGVVVGNRPSSGEPSAVTNNYFEHGNVAGEAIYVGSGGGVVANNTFARVIGTTTGTITGSIPAPTRTLQLTVGDPSVDQTGRNLPSIAKGTTLTIVGVPGGFTVESMTAGGTITLTSDCTAASLPDAVVTFYSAQWGYLVRCPTDDYAVIRDNTVLGFPWTTIALSTVSLKTTFYGNIFEPMTESYGGGIVLGIAGANFIAGTHLNTSMPFTMGGTQRSVMYHGAVPTVGKWKVKDRVENSGAGLNLAWECTVAGDFAGVAPTFVPVGARQAAYQADSVAATVGALVADFNALLAKIRAAGVMAAS